ncbi:MAG: phosphodiester glycosidase family protein [Streptococcaceae bacterium]|nr:phosphodiester glycosidase family protein [Streptococcaceae bacterium]
MSLFVLGAFSACRATQAKNTSVSSSSAGTNASIFKGLATVGSYKDSSVSIDIATERLDASTIWLADVTVSEPSGLKTAFGMGTFGKNRKQPLSEMVKSAGAIFAINGDYYAYRDDGFVFRNGVMYRATPNTETKALVMDKAGDLSVVNQSSASAQDLQAAGALNVWSFGPTLVENSEIAIEGKMSGAQTTDRNPRTAIGQLGKNHYLFVVADGRTQADKGLTFAQLADIFKTYHATIAYNLDGGGSSEMIFKGKILNHDYEVVRTGKERPISDMIYVK